MLWIFNEIYMIVLVVWISVYDLYVMSPVQSTVSEANFMDQS